MNRREFLVLCSASLLAERSVRLKASRYDQSLATEGWRLFEITTHVHVQNASGITRAWLPTPLVSVPYQQTLGDTYQAENGTSVMVESDDIDMLLTEWAADVDPVLTMTSRVATKDYAVDLTTPHVPPPPDLSTFAKYLRGTKLIPVDGIVKDTANQITRGAGTDIEKARAIYEWIVDNTFRDPKTRGCGTGDIRFMLETKNFGGKCADINALFVGLARAAGLPARDVYGLRVAASRRGATSLGVSSADVTKAQHCRAEVYLVGFGWVPVDPADVRKVALEEPPGHLPITHEKVRYARARLFGSWEMNWVGYNRAHDVTLPRSPGKPLPYFMYPQAETANGRADSLDPDTFRYEITVHDVTNA
ncbi:MAG TPA: transglutaminase-like domain-containing protein [Vicinamibacterales bacterium]|nr:transglutaminase-like domain-containing protein [Vicinamibacterales bacterium]